MRPAVSQATLTPGTILSKRFRIEEVIGSGGYASVYRATDLTFGYERAIKEVTDPDRGVRSQFQLEAELLIETKHPNIPHGYRIFEDMGRMYLVMEYVKGKDLEELLNDSLTQKGKPLDEAQVLRWAISICDALAQVHSLKTPIIHRDIKPANIKITPEGRPVLIDFGLAKLQSNGPKKLPTMTAAQGVSPGFAPPEQYMARGRTDARTDIYGLGATIYACLTGKDPAEAPARLLAQTGTSATGAVLLPLRRLNPKVSETTERIVMKALELSPAQRQQTAIQLRDELTESLRRLGAAPAPAAATTAQPAVRPQKPQAHQAPQAAPIELPANQQPGSTLIMGVTCPRCGTQNTPTAIQCVNCKAPLPQSGQPAQNSGGKRAGVGQGGGLLGGLLSGSSNKHAVPAAQRAQATPAAPTPQIQVGAPPTTLGKATGRQAAVKAQSASPAAQSNPANQGILRSTGKQVAVAPSDPPTLSPQNTAAVAAVNAAGRGAPRGASGGPAAVGVMGAPAPVSGRNKAQANGARVSGKQPAVALAGANAAVVAQPLPRGWINLGSTPLGARGKGFLVLSLIEMLWGLTIIGLGALAIYENGRAPSTTHLLELGGLLLAVILVFGVIGGQVISRPIYRRGVIGKWRRRFQGIGLFIVLVAAHALAIWGATVFGVSAGQNTFALTTYLMFGLVVLVAGALSTANTLG